VKENPPVPFRSRSAPHTDEVSDPGYPQYGPPPGYGPTPGHGPTSGYGPPPAATWPHEPGRPGLATAAGVLGHVTAGLTIVFSLIFLVITFTGAGDATTLVLLLGLPCSIGLITGANQLLRRESERNLFACAALSVGVLVLSLLIGLATLAKDDLVGQTVFIVLAVPLPLLTAIFARTRSVRNWVAAR
jgi:hypothetical protein